ncbi:imidazole glycerol phosphate synthase subunit HisH [Microscilla marina]|uniref:Imidazole glycerol phosphate synthase subunit HisH n=1 Tax=Microscilla marina ATCC 23134 TaxID=313606 RepID=A1ZI95_MICM2|nr:imidazole glycerol phosphate synthase subunit HisH [Microscilla marina]EAY29763.1 imidazole glycerol phosphate synthase, glutamine amidotransferase subunit [Microscilla marina ATCC 23134]
MITIIDYGIGNLGSVFNMFKKIGAKAKVTSNLSEIEQAEKLLLPGVGAFDKAMTKINEGRLREVLDYKALEQKVPLLGICLGMQLLTESSEEGKIPGLGWIPAKTIAFKKENNLKVPHMGWNEVKVAQECPLVKDLPEEPRFYFVHSYYVQCDHNENVLLKTHYAHNFDSAIWKDNIYGAQFHPEKSHKFGMKLFDNFDKLI